MATPAKISKLVDEIDAPKNSKTTKEFSNVELKKSNADEKNVSKNSVGNQNQQIKNLDKFIFEKVLNNNTLRKSICLKGHFANIEGDAIVILTQSPFEEVLFRETPYFSKGNTKITFENDSYGNLKFFPVSELNGKNIFNSRTSPLNLLHFFRPRCNCNSSSY